MDDTERAIKTRNDAYTKAGLSGPQFQTQETVLLEILDVLKKILAKP